MDRVLSSGFTDAKTLLVLAPGAGAPATSDWMTEISDMLAAAGLRVARFNFSYMTARMENGSRKPPPKAEKLVDEYQKALDRIATDAVSGQRILIGGKSLGGRVASLAAEPLFKTGRISGLVCLGYPFHPPKKPEQLRTAHLMDFTCPTLMVQGERDPFGGPSEVASYGLPRSIGFHWATDGDHDLAPRRASGETLDSNLAAAVRAIMHFADGL